MISHRYFGKTLSCTCGRTHAIRPMRLVYEDDAIAQLPDLLGELLPAPVPTAVLMDIRTREVAGRVVLETLRRAGWDAREILIPDTPEGGSPVCDDLTLEATLPAVQGCGLVVTVGGGVMCDMGKLLADRLACETIAFATAASMNGYTSANIAPTLKGVKSLVYGRAPLAVLACPSILADAPWELTSAGLGDVLAKSVSSADWYLNHALFGDYYCPQAVELVADLEPLYLDRPADVRDRKPVAIDALFDALLLTGVAMTMAGTSAPASGGEHLISHSLDMLACIDKVPHDYHGRQVGVGTILAAEVYQQVLAVEQPRFVPPKSAIDAPLWGPLKDVVADQFAAKADRLAQVSDLLAQTNRWDNLRAELADRVRPPATIRQCLKTAGAAWRAEDLGVDTSRLATCLRHGDEIRSRFTVLDLANRFGLLPARAADLAQNP